MTGLDSEISQFLIFCQDYKVKGNSLFVSFLFFVFCGNEILYSRVKEVD